MSTDSNKHVPQTPGWYDPNPRNSPQGTYPTSGAFQHLPIRVTITGQPAAPHPNATKIFLRDLPAHCYTLPNVTLNFTIIEMLVLLPNWFKNKAICARFLNNNLTANVHFAILEEYRELSFVSDHEREKARRSLADECRKTMRKFQSGWTRAKHAAPLEWDPFSIAMDGFVPDDVRFEDYRRPASILLRDLMIGVKKLPGGSDAGDLTRAVEFTLESGRDYLFPDDLPTILDHIGRTQVTKEHTDRPIVRRYSDMKRLEDHAKRYPKQQDNLDKDSNIGGVRSLTPHRVAQDQVVQLSEAPSHMKASQYVADPEAELLAQQVLRMVHAADHHMQDPQVDRASKEMDSLLRPYLLPRRMTPLVSSHYSSGYLLRYCVEGDIAFDGSPLARAARFAQRPGQLASNWTVDQVSWLNDLLDAAREESVV